MITSRKLLTSDIPCLSAHDEPMNALDLMDQFRIAHLPVVENNKLLGLISEDALMDLESLQGANQRGGILVLEMWEKDYSMQQISRIIEENNAKILSTSVSPGEGGKIEVNLKLNQPDLNAIISSFERFGYNVKANYQESAYTEDLRKRYDELMRILNI